MSVNDESSMIKSDTDDMNTKDPDMKKSKKSTGKKRDEALKKKGKEASKNPTGLMDVSSSSDEVVDNNFNKLRNPPVEDFDSSDDGKNTQKGNKGNARFDVDGQQDDDVPDNNEEGGGFF